jgi:hypothetical protein
MWRLFHVVRGVCKSISLYDRLYDRYSCMILSTRNCDFSLLGCVFVLLIRSWMESRELPCLNCPSPCTMFSCCLCYISPLRKGMCAVAFSLVFVVEYMLFQKVSFWKGKSAVKHEFIGDVYRAYFLI